MDAIDKIKDADDALMYVDMAKSGIVSSLTEIHTLLKEAYSRTEDQAEIIKELLEKLEQLNINLKQYEHR